jgi:hypothetical protein
VTGPKPKRLEREVFGAKTRDVISLRGLVTQVQNQGLYLLDRIKSVGRVRILRGMACILKKASYNHHSLSINLCSARMLSKMDPDELSR